MKLKALGLILLLVALGVSLDLSSKVSRFWSEATGKKAEIVVEADREMGKITRMWPNFAQGGESSEGMLEPTVTAMKALSPNYVRIDHIYDFYSVVEKDNGVLKFNWEKLDKEVEAILKMGAKPMLALSYMPPALAGGVTDQPDNWNEWQTLVRATIEHYSGKGAKNIDQVYYEVWNEPDLFGDWKIGRDKDYLQLYRQSALAADGAKEVNSFKLGGPGTTGMYRNWIEAVFKLIVDENLRFDFISWHDYSLNPESFKGDVETVNQLMQSYPQLALKEKVITEWGLDSEVNPSNDNQLGASHTVASVFEMLGGVSKVFSFEIIGRWGIVNENSGEEVKPRYKAFSWLNKLGETRIYLTGEGSFVKGVASKTGETIQVDLVNFDANNAHSEAVPVIVKNLTPGSFEIVIENFNGQKENRTIQINNGTWTSSILMRANEIVRISLTNNR